MRKYRVRKGLFGRAVLQRANIHGEWFDVKYKEAPQGFVDLEDYTASQTKNAELEGQLEYNDEELQQAKAEIKELAQEWYRKSSADSSIQNESGPA